MDKEKLIQWLKSENPKQKQIATCRFIISLVEKIESGQFDRREQGHDIGNPRDITEPE